MNIAREKIAEICEKQFPFRGEVAESYFGAKRVKGKRGRDHMGKQLCYMY